MTTDDAEVWKSIPGADGYEASSHGRIRNLRYRGRYGVIVRQEPKVLKQSFKPSRGGGYYTTSVCVSGNGRKKTMNVHELVLLAFKGPKLPGMECRHHPDRDTRNNRADNLLWGTHLENCQDRCNDGNDTNGERNGCSKLTNEDVLEIRRVHKAGRVGELAARFGVEHSSISHIVHRKTWRHLP